MLSVTGHVLYLHDNMVHLFSYEGRIPTLLLFASLMLSIGTKLRSWFLEAEITFATVQGGKENREAVLVGMLTRIKTGCTSLL